MFAVADGRVKNDLGAIASARAVQMMVEGFSRVAEGASLASVMPRLVQDANGAVHDEALEPKRRGHLISTTLVCCALRNDTAFISHVGDSRCYQVRGGEARLLTQDHTRAVEQCKAGAISSMQAEHHDRRHQLTRALGPEMPVDVETGSVALQADDVLILCTDGLYDAIYPEDIARIASQNKNAGEVARELVAYAVQSDGSDNATAQVIQIRSIEMAGAFRTRPATAAI